MSERKDCDRVQFDLCVDSELKLTALQIRALMAADGTEISLDTSLDTAKDWKLTARDQ